MIVKWVLFSYKYLKPIFIFIITMNDIETFEKFDDMELREELLRGLYAYGFEKPSMIQQKAIVQLAKGKDLIAQSQSGTGKTGAFVLGMLQKIDLSLKKPQVLILSPTRELSHQIFNCIEALGTYMDISPQLLIGGKNISTYLYCFFSFATSD